MLFNGIAESTELLQNYNFKNSLNAINAKQKLNSDNTQNIKAIIQTSKL